jgi:hypothetical protein
VLIGGDHRLKLTGAVLVVALASLVFGVAGAGAPPPEDPVQGEIYVGQPCVVFGHNIDFGGVGFAPKTPVHVFVSTSRYTLPGTEAHTIVRSNQAGEISGFLKAPEGGAGARWEWRQQAIFASGLNRGGEHEGQSFDLVVVGTPAVCRVLRREPV